MDKQRILEFSSKTYLKGVEECLEQLDDFYAEFNEQDFWKMDMARTALHVNIGVNQKKVDWNPIKGLVMMGDVNRSKKTPFVFSDIMWRLNNRFTKSLLDGIKKNLSGEIEKDYLTKDPDAIWDLEFRHRERLAKHKEYIKQNIDKLDLHNIKQVEDFINPYLIAANKDFYIKEFGVKLVELENDPGYVEFRYVGGIVGKDLFKDKILYFCYIVYLMTNKEYKEKEYHKKLYKFVEDIKQIISTNEGIKWYNKGSFEKEDDKEEEPISFYKGEIIKLVDRNDCYYDEDEKHFRNTNRHIDDDIMEVDSDELKTINGHLCVSCKYSGWYRVDCVEKIVKEGIKWYNKGKFEEEDDDVEEMELKIGDEIYMLNSEEAIYRISPMLAQVTSFKKQPIIDKSNYRNGVKIGRIKEIDYINDEKCVSIYGGEVWYRATHITNEKIQ